MKQANNQKIIDFMGKRMIALGFSLLLIISSIVAISTRGLNFGIDFTGGYLIEASFDQEADLNAIRQAMEKAGFKDAQVQNFGTSRDILVRIAPRENINKASIGDDVLTVLKSVGDGKVDMRRVEYVGPQVGEELRDDGGIAMLVALGGILVYVSLRFQFKSAVGSIVALVHDVIITVGTFAMTQMEFDLTVLAAILAVIGYSLNDTVVVLDRVREMFRSIRKTPAETILNLSITQTLSRTLITSLTTILVLIALFVFGGDVIHGFATALLVGVFIGTYSSIYVASSMLMTMNVQKQDFLVATKEQMVDDAP